MMKNIMRKTNILLLLLLLIAGYSCARVTSLNPLSDPVSVTFDDRLKGVWHYHTEDNTDVYLHFGKADDNKTLMMSIEHLKNGKLSRASSVMFPAKINNKNYMSVMFKEETDDISRDHLGYYFAKYELINNNRLIISIMNTGKIIDAIEAGKLKGEITYRELHLSDRKERKRRAVDAAKLTDSSENIIEFIEKTDDSILFPDSEKNTFEKLTNYPQSEVKIYMDRESAGWAYKASDYAFVVEKEDCRIQWNAVENKDGDRSLEVRRNCKTTFAEQIELHRAILAEVRKKWPLDSFRSINWGSLCQGGDWEWCKAVARASLESEDYIDYWKNYPNSKLKEVNTLFVQLANSTHSYSALSELLNEFGVKIKLESVEKVFSARLSKLPFDAEFPEASRSGNPRAMYNVGMAYFYIVK